MAMAESTLARDLREPEDSGMSASPAASVERIRVDIGPVPRRIRFAQPVTVTALEQEHKVVLSSSTSPMMRGEDLMVWEPALQIAPRARGGGPQGDQWGPAKRPPRIRPSR